MVVMRNRNVTERGPRLDRKTLKGPDCWEWQGFLDPSGYGVIRTGRRPGRLEKTHRVAWELANGPIPTGMLVCHRCDNPKCVRPDHLFLGTPTDNNADRAAKGRNNHVAGVAHPMAKLTEDDVRAIREALARGERQRDVAARFGVSQPVVTKINRGTGWTHVS